MIKKVLSEGKVPVKIWTDEIDSMTYDQLNNMSQLPFIHKHISVMPDGHGGKGACVGSVIPTNGAIIPAAVGVDIGCGMMAVETNLTSHDFNDSLLNELNQSLQRSIPTGGGAGYNDNFKDSKFNTFEFALSNRTNSWDLLQNRLCEGLKGSYDRSLIQHILIKHPDIYGKNRKGSIDLLYKKGYLQLGSLGGGNHFIEICVDERDVIWVMLHSGSRGIGNIIGNYFIGLAKKEMERFFIQLPDKDLSYLVDGTEYFEDYIDALNWCQEYARINREVMMDSIFAQIRHKIPHVEYGKFAINCHHNYTNKENHYGKNIWVSRKGAIRAREGDMGIIPGSMGAKSFIVRGKGSNESFHSCSHGAGRKMSRTEAKKQFNFEDLKRQTNGIACSLRESIVDEIPSAYKDIDTVMENQKDLVEVVHTLKQILNIKGD